MQEVSIIFQKNRNRIWEISLYYSKQETGNLGLRISMMTGQIGNMDYTSDSGGTGSAGGHSRRVAAAV